MKNAVLIGMPGCGKSTCGVLVAKALCMSFADTDLIIGEREGMSLQSIINEKGNEYFAEAEEKAVCESQFSNCIVATGGSVVYSDKAMRHLKTSSVVVYLKISLETMIARITNLSSRGILLDEGETLETMYGRRATLYEKYADITVDLDGTETGKAAELIADAIREKHR